MPSEAGILTASFMCTRIGSSITLLNLDHCQDLKASDLHLTCPQCPNLDHIAAIVPISKLTSSDEVERNADLICCTSSPGLHQIRDGHLKVVCQFGGK